MPQVARDAMNAFEEHDRANIDRVEHKLIFTSGTTEALNMVAQGMTWSVSGEPLLRAGDEIIVSGLEHHANLLPWQQVARRTGAVLRILLPDAEGRLHPDDLRRMLSARTRVFALTACSNATGYHPPAEALLSMAAEAGAITVLDAAQAVSHGALDVSALRCDFAALSSHKMYGPMGMGGRSEEHTSELQSPLNLVCRLLL